MLRLLGMSLILGASIVLAAPNVARGADNPTLLPIQEEVAPTPASGPS